MLDQEIKLIPEGKFLMGSEAWGDYEGPVHEVFISDFYIDIHHVTNAAFDQFVRGAYNPDDCAINIGFRCAKDA